MTTKKAGLHLVPMGRWFAGKTRRHAMSHALHYGTSVFEGIRVTCNKGPVVFRYREHMQRLYDSAKNLSFPGFAEH